MKNKCKTCGFSEEVGGPDSFFKPETKWCNINRCIHLSDITKCSHWISKEEKHIAEKSW